MSPVVLGFRAVRGGSVVVGVEAGKGEPRLVLSTFLATAAGGDRLSYEPYHVAAETPAEAASVVAEGRMRQDALAVKGLGDVLRTLNDQGCEPAVAALLVNRAGWVTDLLAYSLSDPGHPPVAEGLAVRDALRIALGRDRHRRGRREVASRGRVDRAPPAAG